MPKLEKSNYEIAKEYAQKLFLQYDTARITEKFGLKADEDYLYIDFVGRPYRIARRNGGVQWSDDGFASAADAGFEETLSIFDVLCNSKENLRLSGRFVKLESLPKMARVASSPGGSLFGQSAALFDHRLLELARACEKLGGTPQKVGDVSYQIPVFSFLPIQLQFWESDEEFPASLQFMWDENILDYMRFETTFYVAGHVLNRLRELIG